MKQIFNVLFVSEWKQAGRQEEKKKSRTQDRELEWC